MALASFRPIQMGMTFFSIQGLEHHDRRLGYLVHDQADEVHFDELFHWWNLYSIKTRFCQLFEA